MNRNEARIALAERMGWVWHEGNHVYDAHWRYKCRLYNTDYNRPLKTKEYILSIHFDPFTNSADCDALLDWLVVSEGYYFNLESMVAKGVCHLAHLIGPEDQEGFTDFPDWTKRHEAITLCALEALGIKCDEKV